MRGLIFDGTKVCLKGDIPDPIPAGREVLIKPLRMGICATDLEIVRGMEGFAGVLGHEFVGKVVECGPDVVKESARQLTGQRVVGTICVTCGDCDMCRQGIRSHCRRRTVLGISGHDGCFADYFVLPVENILLVPESVPDEQAVFVEPLAAAFRILEQIDSPKSLAVTVLGDGRLGLLCAQVLHRAGASVRCIGRSADKKTPCEKWGIPRGLVAEVRSWQDQDLVVDCTASADGFSTAIRMVRPQGTIVLKTTVTASSRPIAAELHRIVVDEITVIGSRCGPFDRALSALATNEIDVCSLISREMNLAEGVDAMRMAAERGVIKVLLSP